MDRDDADDGNGSDTDWLNLKQVARLLDVHYMTAYRYVRNGRLPAVKAGTEWRVARAALTNFMNGTAPEPPSGDARWADRLITPLEQGDEPAAMRVMEEALASGHDLAFCFVDVLRPALASVEARASSASPAGSAVQPILASVVAQRLVTRLGARFRKPGRTRGTVVVGAPPGEHHQLAVAMIADLVRADGYGVLELGTDVPANAFVEAATHAPRLVAVGLGITTTEHLDQARAVITGLRAAASDVPIMIGGQAVLNGDMAALIGADGWASDGRQAVRVLTELIDARSNRAASTLR